MSSNSLVQVIRIYLENHATVSETFYALIEMEVMDMMFAREISQAEGAEIMGLLA